MNIDGIAVTVTNLEKVFYPAAGFTKGHVIDYYIRVAKYLLPHLEDRPVTLKRYPNGVGGEFFYEKDAPGYTPSWVKTFPVPRRSRESDICYVLVNDLATLVWCANIATIEFHPFLHRAPAIGRPTEVVFDLDPGEGSSLLACAEVAFILRELLDALKLKCFPKVSGSKGIQIYVPLNTGCTYDQTQLFAHTAAQLLERQHPRLIVSEMAKIARKNRVFIDWSQNADFKTTIGVYSLRAKRQHPFVSVPVTWEELDQALSDKNSSMLYFQPAAALERLERVGDLFGPVRKLKQKLPRDFVAASAPPSHKPPQVEPPAADQKKKKPGPVRASRQGGRRRFVVRKQAGGRGHYELGLEMRHALKSWVLPEGIPEKAGEQPALATEDRPIENLERQDGRSTKAWDIGTYEIIEGDYDSGLLRLSIKGEKLQGQWVLTRDGAGDAREWRIARDGPISKRRTDAFLENAP